MDVAYSTDDDTPSNDEEYFSESENHDNSISHSHHVSPASRPKRKKRDWASFSPIDNSLVSLIRPQLGLQDFGDLRGLLDPSVLTLPPDPMGNITAPPSSRYFGVHLLSLQLGLRFPLHKFVIDFLNYYQIAPGQLVPNGHQAIAGFLSVCHERRVEPTLGLFQALFVVSRASGEGKGFILVSGRPHFKLFDDRSTFNKDWKSKFIFVCVPNLSHDFKWSSQVRRQPPIDTSPSLRDGVIELTRGGPLKVASYTAEWRLAELGFVRAQPAVLDPGAMSSRSDRYLSRSQNPPSKKSKIEKGKGKKDQGVGTGSAEGAMPPPLVVTPPPVLAPTPPRVAASSSQPPGGTPTEHGSRPRTNLVRLGMDVPPGASLMNSTLDAVEYAQKISPPADISYLSAMDVNLLQERYLRHIFEVGTSHLCLRFFDSISPYCLPVPQALMEGQVIHAQRQRAMDFVRDEVQVYQEDNRRLKELLAAREGSLSAKEGELGALRKDHEALKVALKKEQEDHEMTRATCTVDVGKAEEIYKGSSKYKEDLKSYLGTPEATDEFLKTKAGRDAVEAEAQMAFEIGMYTKQQQIFPVLRREVPGFDPTAMGLLVIEENPDPEAKSGGDANDPARLKEIHIEDLTTTE